MPSIEHSVPSVRASRPPASDAAGELRVALAAVPGVVAVDVSRPYGPYLHAIAFVNEHGEAISDRVYEVEDKLAARWSDVQFDVHVRTL